MLDNMLIKRKLCTTIAISNVGFWAKIEVSGLFSREQFIYLWIEI